MKALRTAGMVVAAVALVAATAGAAAPAVAGVTAGGIAGVASAATLGAIGAYGGLAAGVLSAVTAAVAPGVSNQGSATSFQTNPQSGLPYAMGRTRMSGLRIYANTNTRPGYTKFNDLLWFGALLSIGGQIDSIEKFTADNEVVTFDASGNAIGTYHDYQGQKIHLGGAPMASALALSLGGGTAPGWTSQHKLSGITHAMWCLRYNKQGEMYGAGAPEPAWIGKWVKVYDPRLDSTYPGGSGSCRALQESTYVWSDNPGLHALTWALGRWQNGKRTCGIGAPVANIRVAEFVECANVCDANAWKVGGVEWTTDSKWDTLKRILQAGGAVPTQTAAMIGCLVSMPRTAIATIESRHLHDNLSIAATKSRRDRFNTVIPRYVDEDSDWSVISGTAVTVPDYVTADKGQRTKEIDFPLVQVFSGAEAKQPGQLAAYEIVNSREAGPWAITVGPEFIGLQTGDVVNLNVPEEGLDNQPVLIKQRGINPATGKVTFTVETETFAKHAFALGETTTPPAPWSPTAPDLKPPAPVQTEWTVSGTTSGEGFPALLVAGDSEMPSADAIVIDYRLHTAGETPDAGWTNSAILSAVDTVRHVIAPLESQTAYDVRISYRVGTIDGDTTIFEQVITGLGKITTIENQLQDQDEALAQLDEDIEQAEANIAAAQAAAAAAQADADAAKTSVEAAQQDIIAQGQTITQQGAAITAAQADIIANATSIQTVSNTVSSQGSAITTLQQAVTSNTGSIATLQTTVSSQGGLISSNATAITTLQGTVSTLTTRVTAGNGNLLSNGLPDNGTAGWTGSATVTAQSTSLGPYLRVNSTAANTAIYSDKISIIVGEPYTASCDSQYLGAGAGNGTPTGGYFRTYLSWRNASDAEIGTSLGSLRATHGFNNAVNRPANAVTGTAPSGAVFVRLIVVATNAGTVGTSPVVLDVRQVKIERGTTWTPYSSEASVTQSFSAINTANGQVSTLQTTVSTQGGLISTNATAITTLQGTVSSLSSTVSSQGSAITNLQTASSTQAGDIATLKTRVTAGGGNILTNTEFAGSLNGWTQANVGQAGIITFGINGAGATYQVQGTNAATINQSNNLSTGYAEYLQDFPAEAGKLYEFSTWYASHRCLTSYYVLFLNSAGSDLGSGGAAVNQPAINGGEMLSGWGRVGFKTGSAPSGTARGRVYMRKLATNSGTTDSWAWFLRPQIIETVPEATTPQRYSSGTDRVSIETTATAVSTLNTQYSNLSTTVSTQGSTISTQQTAITTINTNLATLTTRVASGSQNLMPNGGFDNGTVGWTSGGSLSLGFSNTVGKYLTVTSNASSFFVNSPAVPVDVGTVYTVSADTQFLASAGSMVLHLIWLNSGGTEISRVTLSPVRGGHNFDNQNINRAANAVSGTAPANAVNALVQFQWNGVSGLTHAAIRLIKFEPFAPWTPYSSEAAIRVSYESISTLNTNVASLSTTVSTQGVTITQQQTAITTINNNVTTLYGRAALTLDVNGRVTGWETNNNGTVGDFTIRADRFRVIPPGGAGSDGFYIDIDSSNRTTQYILSGGVRVVEIGWLN